MVWNSRRSCEPLGALLALQEANGAIALSDPKSKAGTNPLLLFQLEQSQDKKDFPFHSCICYWRP